VESPAIQQPQRTKETAADDTTVDWLDSSAQRARSDSLEETPLVAARKKNDSDAETISLQQEDDTEGKNAAEKSSEEPPQKVFIIQVGAFRSLAAAMNLMKGLREKGYDVYLDGRILPNLGRLC
jgi:cell division septation protein DedD